MSAIILLIGDRSNRLLGHVNSHYLSTKNRRQMMSYESVTAANVQHLTAIGHITCYFQCHVVGAANSPAATLAKISTSYRLNKFAWLIKFRAASSPAINCRIVVRRQSPQSFGIVK